MLLEVVGGSVVNQDTWKSISRRDLPQMLWHFLGGGPSLQNELPGNRKRMEVDRGGICAEGA